MNLGLGPPLQSQIVRLAETPVNIPANVPANVPAKMSVAPVEQRRAQGVPSERNY
jgi:hypothetical protein